MNSCILMAQIVSNPELRSTQDQTSVSTMMVEFEPTREGEAPGKVQVEGWGSLAEDIKNTYSVGDCIIIEGRLSMNLFDMPEGYKEKRAKLVASRIYPVNGMGNNLSSPQQAANVVEFAPAPEPQPTPTYAAPTPAPAAEPAAAPASSGNEDWDEIPF
ncbi:MAG: single-stranded DNA-binding protein [Cyanobacteria bacterium J06623_7]